MSRFKDITIIVNWNGKKYLITNFNYEETVAMLKDNIAKHTNVQPKQQKLLNFEYKGVIVSFDVRFSSLALKSNFKLMMDGTHEADIQIFQNTIDNHDILDDNDEQTPCNFHNMEPISSISIYELRKPKKTAKGIDDICDDVIVSILYLLELEDLANISDTNKRLRNIAGSVFSRKYGNRFISIDHFPKNDLMYRLKLLLPILYKKKRIVRIGDLSASFKLLRNFGGSIKYIRLHYGHSICPWTKTNLSALSWKHVLEYVSEFCANSVEVLEVYADPSFSLNKPLSKEQNMYDNMYDNMYYNMYDNIDPLEVNRILSRISTKVATIEKYFPKLENVYLKLYSENVDSIISFLRMNRHIEKLTLKIDTPEHNYNDLIYSAIDENLTQLKKLRFNMYSMRERDVTRPIPINRRFKTIDTFGIVGKPCGQFELFEFNDLKKLTIGFKMYSNEDTINFILRHKKLKILKLCRSISFYFDSHFRTMLRELRDLVKVTIDTAIEGDVARWKLAFGIEWECTEYKTPNEKFFILKFLKKT